jgi:SAM-dependent methyltransferase
VQQVLAKLSPTAPDGPIVDVGCGTGGNHGALREASGRPVAGFDVELSALSHVPLGPTGGRRVTMALAEHLPVPDRSAGVVTSLDVLEHLDDDVLALCEYHRILAPGGIAVLTVPAYEWLWSAHDDWTAHRRRYTSRRLADAMSATGFDVLRRTYFHSFLVPPATLLRRTPLRRMVNGAQEEVGASSRIVDMATSGLAAVERSWASRLRMPFGLSLLAIGRRVD